MPLFSIMIINKKTKNNIIAFICVMLFLIKLKFYDVVNFVGESVRMAYVGSYQDIGFGSRLFVGSIIRLFTDYVPQSLIIKITITIVILIYLIVAFALKKLLDMYESYTDILIAIFLMFICWPMGSLFYNVWAGFIDTICLFLYIISIIMLCSKNKIIKELSIILVMMSIASHTMPFFMFSAMYFIVLLHRLYLEKNDFKYVLYNFLLRAIPIFLLLFFFQFYKKINFSDAYSMEQFLINKSDAYSWADFLQYEYFTTIIENAIHHHSNAHMKLHIAAFFTYLFNLPIFIMFLRLWHGCAIESKDKNEKIIYMCCFLSFIPTIVCHIATDYMRWNESYFLVNFAVLVYFLLVKNELVCKRIFGLEKLLKKYRIIYILILIVLLIFNINPKNSYAYNGLIYDIVGCFYNGY